MYTVNGIIRDNLIGTQYTLDEIDNVQRTVDNRINTMTNVELLERISEAIDEVLRERLGDP